VNECLPQLLAALVDQFHHPHPKDRKQFAITFRPVWRIALWQIAIRGYLWPLCLVFRADVLSTREFLLRG